jgi:hypothetical protein
VGTVVVFYPYFAYRGFGGRSHSVVVIMVSELTKAYKEYLTAKARIRKAQREEFQKLIKPYEITLGNEIVIRRKFVRAEDVAHELGLKGRVFINNMAKLAAQPDPEPVHEPTYSIERLGNGSYAVSVHGEEWTVEADDQGYAIAPDQWLTGTSEQRALYAKILREIEDEIKAGT